MGSDKTLWQERVEVERRGRAQQLRGQQLRGAGGGGDAQTFMPYGQPQTRLLGVLANQRLAVRARRAKPGPAANAVQLAEIRQKIHGPAQHATEHRGVDGRVFVVELPGRADEQLTGRALLHVERHGRAVALVRDQQMAFLGLQRQVRAQVAGMDAIGKHHGTGLQPLTIDQPHAVALNLYHLGMLLMHAPGLTLQQPARGIGRIQNPVAGHSQGAQQAGTQRRLG
nr:hypothetical protein [Tanacetum cinerariifolium]